MLLTCCILSSQKCLCAPVCTCLYVCVLYVCVSIVCVGVCVSECVSMLYVYVCVCVCACACSMCVCMYAQYYYSDRGNIVV